MRGQSRAGHIGAGINDMQIDSSTQATVNLLESFICGGVFATGLVIAAIVFFRKHRDVLEGFLWPKPLKKVGPKTLLYRESGTAMAAGGSYRPEAGDLIVPLEPRMISPYMPASPVYGVTDARFLSVFYQPDPKNIDTFVRTLREASGDKVDFAKLDLFLTLKCGSRLLLDARPDCADIAAAYGVKFSGFVFPDTVAPEPKDDRSRMDRAIANMVSAALAQVGGLGVVAVMLAQLEAGTHPLQEQYPELKEPVMKQHVIDVVKQLLDRAKSAQ